ncbi:MAG: endonuclease [Steroidobacteraceae bacterium]|nr:endonuclease [Steroidobacteraceae bacterium]
MPEGPTIVILREQVERFAGCRIIRAEGNARVDMARLTGRRVEAFRSWGKHFLIDLHGFALRVHFLMFGSYTIDERKPREPRLSLAFPTGELNLYSCAIRVIEGDLDAAYDWRGDVMSDAWDARAACRKLRAMPDRLVCDALLDQEVFAGVGNIIKNEVLYRIRVHPLSRVGALPPAKLRELVKQARQYSFEFLEWKKQFVLRQHWLAHNKGTCDGCGRKLVRAYLGETDRRTFFCAHDQRLYATPAQARAAARTVASARKGGRRLPTRAEPPLERSTERATRRLPRRGQATRTPAAHKTKARRQRFRAS